MTTQHTTNGPAFPVSLTETGMTLRDYFASCAMQGDWAVQSSDLGYFAAKSDPELLASSAKLYYRMADAMLQARETTP